MHEYYLFRYVYFVTLRACAQHSPPAKHSKRTNAEQAAEPTQPTKGKGRAKGKAAKAKPPPPGRLLDARSCAAARGSGLHCGAAAWCVALCILHAAPLLTAAIKAAGAYVQRLEAACHLLHRVIEQATGAQTASSRLTPRAMGAQTASSCSSTDKAASAAASPAPLAPGSISAGELCTLLLTDQEVLDVVLALHDIRAAQLCHLLSWSGSHALKLPPPSEALAKQLSQSQWSVPGSQLLPFVSALKRDRNLKGDSLLRVWDSMHRAMLLVLAALQSLQIRPYPQHPDPATIAHTSTTTQLPPGYHRCSACLLLSLRLVICLAHHCAKQHPYRDQALARLHSTLPGLLLGLRTAMTVMEAAGHPEAQAQRSQFVRCLLRLMLVMGAFSGDGELARAMARLHDKVTTSCPDQLARLLASSPAVTGWPGPLPAKPSPMDSSTAEDSQGLGRNSGRCSSNRAELAALNAYAHLAQALCAVLGRQEEELGTTYQAEEWDCLLCIVRILEAVSAPSHPGAVTTLGPSPPSPSASTSSLQSVILSVLPRSVTVFQACIVAVRLAVKISSVTSPSSFPHSIRVLYFALCRTMKLMVQLWPDQRCRPAMLRVLARTAAAGAHSYTTLALLLDDAPELERAPELEQTLSTTITRVCFVWMLLLAPPGRYEQLSGASFTRSDGQCKAALDAANDMPKVLHQPPSAQQLAPLALDLVWGMEGMLQMMHHHWCTFQTVVIEETGTNTFSFFASCGTSLDLFGRVIEVLALSSVVGPAGLAAQPAAWLPCGNSLVEGWCTRLLDRVCHLLCITTPGLKGSLEHKRLQGCRTLADSHKFLLQGLQQAPSSMSPEAERLLACLTLVLTVALPLDTWLAAIASVQADEVKVIEQGLCDLLTRVEPEQVWSWQALAAGTPAEASLASVLQGAAKKLRLPHLVAPAPQGWQPGRLTLDRGRGPPELMRLPMQPGSHTASSLRACAQHSPPAKHSKRTNAEQAAEPTQPTKGKGRAKGKAAKAKPPPPGSSAAARGSGLHCGSAAWCVALCVLHAAQVLTAAIKAAGAYVQCLEAACHLLHRGIEQATAAQTASSRLTPQAMGAQPSSSDPAAHKADSAATVPTPSAPGSISAGELCTLLLTDQEVLDVVLALHDIRAAQLCYLLSWPGSHALKLPPPSEALAKQLSQSQWSVPGSQLLSFVSALERDHDNSLEGDPLLRVWDSMHRAMLLVLAALQSLPIRPHPQHLDTATIAHTSTTTQLPPGYHRCSACLLLSLRLAICLAQHCVDQRSKKYLALARLHATLPGLLLGLSTAVTVMQAAGHPQAQAQRVQFVRCMLHLGRLVIFNVYEDYDITHSSQDVLAWLRDKVTTSCPDQLAGLLASSPVVTGWPGPLPAKPTPLNSSTAEDSQGLGHNSGRCSSNRGRARGRGREKGSSTGRHVQGCSTPYPADPAALNAYAHLAQALCAVLGRQEEELGITCQAEANTHTSATTQLPLGYHRCSACLLLLGAEHSNDGDAGSRPP
ncbi:hypothetical protein QJQ45_004987 [Haematococcus lacustris]|nr:hypothetical protein QJQ45_004987 [Haematococcus lacustris]